MEIKRIKTKEECALCDEFLSKLNAYESCFDDILNSEFKFKEIHEKSTDHSNQDRNCCFSKD